MPVAMAMAIGTARRLAFDGTSRSRERRPRPQLEGGAHAESNRGERAAFTAPCGRGRRGESGGAEVAPEEKQVEERDHDKRVAGRCLDSPGPHEGTTIARSASALMMTRLTPNRSRSPARGASVRNVCAVARGNSTGKST